MRRVRVLPRRRSCRRISSRPAVMLPHWSAPPICSSTPIVPVQVGEVVRLQQHVAEFGERQAALEPDLDRVLGEHVRDREVLAGVAQEVDQRQLAEPVEVVDHDAPRRRRARSRGTARAASADAATFASSVSRSSRFRSDERPDGSPIIPVPPPTSATGRPPWRCSRSSPKIGTRCPMCSESPDGSKPM